MAWQTSMTIRDRRFEVLFSPRGNFNRSIGRRYRPESLVISGRRLRIVIAKNSADVPANSHPAGADTSTITSTDTPTDVVSAAIAEPAIAEPAVDTIRTGVSEKPKHKAKPKSGDRKKSGGRKHKRR